MLAADGSFYGTTFEGGTNDCFGGCGTIFKVSPTGSLTTLHRFNSTDGSYPYAALIQASDGNLYGTTAFGGSSTNCWGGCGTVFKISPSGAFVTIHNFEFTDGSEPYSSLAQDPDGNLFGTTVLGGLRSYTSSAGLGVVFRIDGNGEMTILHRFDSINGANPIPSLTSYAGGGAFFGETSQGGTKNKGTVFKLTPQGGVTSLYSFCSKPNCFDGYVPYAGLVQATDGNFYGTTSQGGSTAQGTAFSITPEGVLTTLYSFDLYGGAFPFGGLLQDTNGAFYGTTSVAGNGGGLGSVYRFDSRLGPIRRFR